MLALLSRFGLSGVCVPAFCLPRYGRAFARSFFLSSRGFDSSTMCRFFQAEDFSRVGHRTSCECFVRD